MAAIAQSLPDSNSRFAWLWKFFRDEMAPYPGRVALVARMVTAATVVMIVTLTFRIPDGAYGAIYALALSRESLESTASAARDMAIGFVLAGAYVLVGAMLVLDNPMLRFLWVVGTLFLVFYLMSALSSYGASARFGYLIIITIPLWDRHIPAEPKVEGTLWAVGTITGAAAVTLLLEMVFAAFRGTDDLIEGIAERLECVEELLAYYAGGRAVETAAQTMIRRLAVVGTSRLRRMLQRSNYEPQHEQQMGAVVALVGRLVDIAANLGQFTGRISDEDSQRTSKIAQNIAGIRAALTRGVVPRLTESGESETPSDFLLLQEIEKTVGLIPKVFTDAQSLSVYAPLPPGTLESATPFLAEALSNFEHVKFGLKGCLAASLSYVTYNALFWPEISTAVTTCLLTALSTIGASRQKQTLRFAGALVGGFVIGMGAQVFILPYIDSIGGFTVLFVAVMGAAAWVASSSPRLSYFGVQVAVAFCLINLQEFKIQTSLAVARDRAIGILLGLLMMWLAFDRLWSAPAGVEMKKAFVRTLRLLAEFAREPVSKDVRVGSERSYALREAINAQFDKVRSLADGVLFEFRSSRQQDLRLRDDIRQWQPQLRALFVMRIASWKYRLNLPGFELPEAVRVSQQKYDDRSARVLEDMADRLEGSQRQVRPVSEDSRELLEQTLNQCCAKDGRHIAEANVGSFVTLLCGIDGLTNSLAEEIAMEFDRTVLRYSS
jgi:multidrug resistance protein MdtO